jgi:hypothetical protein
MCVTEMFFVELHVFCMAQKMPIELEDSKGRCVLHGPKNAYRVLKFQKEGDHIPPI